MSAEERTAIVKGSPACAGMDRGPAGESRIHLGLPRVRGDGPIAASIISSLIDIGIQMLIMQVITQTTNKVAALAVIGAKAAENYASMFASVVMALPFPANLIAPAVAAASTAKLIAGSLGLVALAEGGITTGPTLAMVGDNPGGREAIIPLNRLSDIFGDRGSAGTPVVIALDGRKVAEAIVPYIPAGVRRRIGGRI